jgi:small subunit ribosomal protein S8
MSIPAITDMIIRLKNGYNAKLLSVNVNYSKKVLNILNVFYKEGFIRGYQINGNIIKIFLKYSETNYAMVQEIKQISKPGSRKYISLKELYSLQNTFGVYILSTSKGFISHLEALKNKVGGELYIYVK